MLLIESVVVAIILITALLCPGLGSKFFDRIEGRLSHLAEKPGLGVVLVGLLALGLRLALLPILPVPKPIVHDEFGYLLIADTFAHGRVTNPTHPMWVHFETFSVVQRPTYQCYTPPAQGAILAAGKLIMGNPFWGVWFSTGVMCATLCWMLQGWLPGGWALIGGGLAVLRWGVFGYWANSYWGGSAGAIGGALVLGAYPRLIKSQRPIHAILMGVGLAILANSRPYEGMVLILPVAIAFLIWIFGKPASAFAGRLRRIVLPLCLTLAAGSALTGYYFWRVTGSPFRSPYQVERETYSSLPYLIWQPLRPAPQYNHRVIEAAYADEVQGFKLNRSWPGLIYVPLNRTVRMWRFFVGPALTLPLLMLVIIVPSGFHWKCISGQTRFLLLTTGVFGVGVIGLEATLFSPHYAAPLAGVILVLVLLSMRRLREWRPRGQLVGVCLTRAIPAACVLLFLVRCTAGPLHIPLTKSHVPAWDQLGPDSFGRIPVVGSLHQVPGNHLVIVRYKLEHNAFAEWVYNNADIDRSKVVWARDMGSAKNQELLEYFKNRRVWLLEADEKPPALSPYQ